MYGITGDICCMISCPKCGFKDISREGMRVVLLKKDIAEKLRENFPNKKVLYTKKSIEELLTLKDLDTRPSIEGEYTTHGGGFGGEVAERIERE